MNITKVSFFAAPALMAGYGMVRLMDGQRGPGFGWTFGHLLMLAGLALFGWVIAGLRRLAPGTIANVFAGIGYIGLAATGAQFCIDIIVGFLSSDAAAKEHNFEQIQNFPGVLPIVYTVIPVFFYLGLLALTVQSAVVKPRPITWWSPVLILAGTAAVATSLDYIPAAAFLYLLALSPLAFRTPRTAPATA